MKKRKYNTASFIEESKRIYGDRYEYDKTEYKTIKDFTTFTCKQHGDFVQRIEAHLLGKEGCRDCYKIKCREREVEERKNNFISSAINLHGDKYDYSNVEYVNNSTKVSIICPVHGVFKQTPSGHSAGRGCSRCGVIKNSKVRSLPLEEFLIRSKEVHGDFYDYSLVDLNGVREKVEIICPIHGKFSQVAYAHYIGSGCPECGNERTQNLLKNHHSNNQGGYYGTSKTSFLYLMEINNEFLKIGVSKNPINRKRAISSEIMGEVKILYVISGQANKLFEFEQITLKDKKLKRHIPKLEFAGKYECFKLGEEEIIMDNMKNFYIKEFSGFPLDTKDIYPDYKSIPTHVREKVMYSIGLYFQEVLLEDFLRASWENDNLLWQEIRSEVKSIMNQYILDATMDNCL